MAAQLPPFLLAPAVLEGGGFLPFPGKCVLGPPAVPPWQSWVQEGIEAPALYTQPAEFDSKVSTYVLVILYWSFNFFRCHLLKDINQSLFS